MRIQDGISLTVLNEDELGIFASRLAPLLERGWQVALNGPLGAGKTAIVRQLARYLGVQDSVSSPSFVLSNEYRGGALLIEHWDLYRLRGGPAELLEPPNKSTIRLVEWGERIPDYQELFDLVISLSLPQSDQAATLRQITLGGKGFTADFSSRLFPPSIES